MPLKPDPGSCKDEMGAARGKEGMEEVPRIQRSNAISFTEREEDRLSWEMETAHTAINIQILQWLYGLSDFPATFHAVVGTTSSVAV